MSRRLGDDVFVPDIECPACGEVGTYWEMRTSLPPHISVSGFEVIAAGVDHPSGTICEEW